MEIFKFGTDREDIGPFVNASLPIVWPRGDFKAFGSTIASDTKIFDIPKNDGGHTKVQFRVEFVHVCTSWPSQSHREAILSYRDYIVLLSCDHRQHLLGFATRRQYEGDAMLPDNVRKATHRMALATPSHKHRI